MSPNHREALTAISSITGDTEYLYSTNHALDTSGGGGGGGNVNLATIAGNTTSVGNGTTDSGTLRVTLSSDSSGQVELAAGANTIGAISNTSFAATQSGTWAVGLSAGTNAIGSITNTSFIATQGTGTNLHVVVDSGSITPSAIGLPGTLVSFITTITTSGTRVNLASNALSQGVVIEAPSTNTGVIYIGGSTVSASVYGAELQPGQSVGLAVSNTNLVSVDTATNGNKVAVIGG